MLPLLTPVQPTPADVHIDLSTPLFLIGSCFSDEIGAKLGAAGFDVLCNPFGTLYNPASIADALQHVANNTPVSEDDLVHHDGHWHSWLHHSRFSHSDKPTCLTRCNEAIRQAHLFLNKRPILLVTFGTAWTFTLTCPPEDGGQHYLNKVVANCHKLPARHFSRQRLTPSDITTLWLPTADILSSYCPHTILTVSPIRHMADGAHGNQLSKSTLLLATDDILRQNTSTSYFDSYEIMMDELRDYRFYARDLCHPSDVAIDIIWERFQQTYMNETTQQQIKRNEKEHLHSLHRTVIRD